MLQGIVRPWWTLRGTERQKAKAEDAVRFAERERLRDLSGGGIKEVELHGRKGFVNSIGAFWPFSSKEERRVARQFAEAGLFPNPLLSVSVESDGSVSLRGLRSGTVYSCDVSNGYVLRPYYKAAATAERQYRPAKVPGDSS